ncbi:MAG TPA: hypothetical protein VEU96_02995 [Bryobacteraceae bacterium]|nr:hypothetical protein [Bryobacteraceae bacterium]
MAADDTEIKGASAFLSGNVSVCVNGTSVKVKDSATGTAAASIPFKNGSYEAFVDAGQLKEGNGVVVVITNGNRRLTNSVVVGASAKLPADACTTPDSQLSSALSPIKLHPALEDGALAVIGVAPLPKGTVVACLKGKALTQIGQVDDQGAFTLNVTDSVTQGKTIDVFVTSADNKTRTKTSVEVAPVKFTEVELSATPKEGQKTIYVNASPTGTVHYSLSAFVNGEQARIIDGSGNETDSVPTSTTGATAIQLKDPLDGGQCVQVVEFETGKRVLPDRSLLGCAATDHAVEKNYAVSRSTPTVAFFDFGRIRSYFVAGSLLSFDGGSFSQPSVFLALNANRNWIWGGMTPVTKDAGIEQTGHRFMFDTFFEARLTTVPVAVGATPTLQSTLTSPKAGELVGGVSAPIIVATWSHGKDPYGFTVGPIAKVGFLTPVGSTTGATVTPQSFYTNYGFGTRLGFQKLTYSSNIAPETISYIDVVSGRFSNFDLNHMRPWRFAFEGLLKVPSTPLFVGFSANIHQNFGLGKGNPASNARDDLRFLFGAKFDAGKLFDAIGQIK